MKIRHMACALLCLSGLPLKAAADTNVNKVYLGAGVGLSEESDFCDLINSDGSGDCDEGDYAGRVMVGYKINPYLGFEFSYVDAEGSTFEESEAYSQGNIDYVNRFTADISLERYSVDVVGMLPLQAGFMLLGRAGYGKNTLQVESKLLLDDEDAIERDEYDEDSDGAAFAVGASYTWRDVEARVMIERIWRVEAFERNGKVQDSDFTLFGAEVLMHFM